MLFDRKTGVVVVLAALALSGARCDEPVQLTPEAAAAFGKLTAGEPGGALMLDADALRRVGFFRGADQGGEAAFLVDLAIDVLPALAADVKDEGTAGALARSAVVLRLVSEWARAPEIHRVGLLLRADPEKPNRLSEDALLLLAVKGGEAENRELLQGLGAAVRAAARRDLLKTANGDLCSPEATGKDLPIQLCVRAAPGLLAVGTSRALGLLAAPGGTPASRLPGPIVRVKANLPGVARVELVGEGTGAIRVTGSIEAEDPRAADAIWKVLDEGVKQLDAQVARRHALVATALGQVQDSLAKDPEAPARLKDAAARATLEKVVDPRGEGAAIRQSLKLARQGTAITCELTIPESAVQRASRFQASAVTLVGVLAAIAIPNFIRYECRAKASKGPLALDAAWTEMERQRIATGRYPLRLDSLALQPPDEKGFSACLPGGCPSSADPMVAAACKAAFADPGPSSTTPALCVAAVIDGKVDLWVKKGTAAPVHLKSACE